jgi:hypothetical protein
MSSLLQNTTRVIRLTPNNNMIGDSIKDIDHLFQLSHFSGSKFDGVKADISDASSISVTDTLGSKCGRYIDTNLDVSTNTGNIWFRGDVEANKSYFLQIGEMADTNDSTIFAQNTGSAFGFMESLGTIYDRCSKVNSSAVGALCTYNNAALIDKGVFIPINNSISITRPTYLENSRTVSIVLLLKLASTGKKSFISKSPFSIGTNLAGDKLAVFSTSNIIDSIYSFITVDNFHLIEVVIDLDAGPISSDKLKMFVDGNRMIFSTMGTINPFPVNLATLNIGAASNSINGIVDELRISTKTYGSAGAVWRNNNIMNQSTYWTATIVPIITNVSSVDGGHWRIQGTGLAIDGNNPTGSINDIPFTVVTATDTEVVIAQGVSTPAGTKIIKLTNSDGESTSYYDSVNPSADINPDLFYRMPPKVNFTGGSTVSADTQYANPMGDVVDNSAGENTVDGTEGGNPVNSSRGGGGGTIGISSRPSWLY